MTEHDWARLVGYALAPLFWLLALTVVLWLVRKLLPSWERTLFDPLSAVIGRSVRHIRASLRRE